MGSVNDNYLKIIHEQTIQDTQSLLDCDDDTLIARDFVHRYGNSLHNAEDEDRRVFNRTEPRRFSFPTYQEFLLFKLHTK